METTRKWATAARNWLTWFWEVPSEKVCLLSSLVADDEFCLRVPRYKLWYRHIFTLQNFCCECWQSVCHSNAAPWWAPPGRGTELHCDVLCIILPCRPPFERDHRCTFYGKRNALRNLTQKKITWLHVSTVFGIRTAKENLKGHSNLKK